MTRGLQAAGMFASNGVLTEEMLRRDADTASGAEVFGGRFARGGPRTLPDARDPLGEEHARPRRHYATLSVCLSSQSFIVY